MVFSWNSEIYNVFQAYKQKLLCRQREIMKNVTRTQVFHKTLNPGKNTRSEYRLICKLITKIITKLATVMTLFHVCLATSKSLKI